MKTKELINKKIPDERKEKLLAEIARLRGALRAVKNVAKMNLSFTPKEMLK